MSECFWRFPVAGGGTRKGISSGDEETFKKNPIAAFAREIIQNSIDARSDNSKPVKIVFDRFNIGKNMIPNVSEISDQMKRCVEFSQSSKSYIKSYEKKIELLKKDTIQCLRVSDYNTTGLIGVLDEDIGNNKFLALTKSSGVSEKSSDIAGGSKGLGKSSAFLMSEINLIFYSTNAMLNVKGETGSFKGYIGVCDLISGKSKDDPNDYTQGTGYYSDSKKNLGVEGLVNFKQSTNRENEYGTDIFIFGFIREDNILNEVISSILDSYLFAIFREELEIEFDNIKINKDTLRQLVYSNYINENVKKSIIAQYRILSETDKVKVYPISTSYGECDLYILPYKDSEYEEATHKCSMIRYPLMKIKDINIGGQYNISAVCEISNNDLGINLRKFENPQHRDWEVDRIDIDSSVRKEIKGVIKDIERQIRTSILNCLKLGENEIIDPDGAGEFLPDDENSTTVVTGSKDFSYTAEVSKPKESKYIENNATIENGGDGVDIDVGNIDSSIDGDILFPEGENDTSGGEARPGLESGEKETGDNEIFVKNNLGVNKYAFIALNSSEGIYKVVFTPNDGSDKCFINLYLINDNNQMNEIEILEMDCNGEQVVSTNKKAFGPFKVIKNQKNILKIKTNQKGYFACNVRIYYAN